MSSNEDHQLRPASPQPPATFRKAESQAAGELPGVFAEEEIDFGFALISREKPNSNSDWDSILATVSISVLRRTSLVASGPPKSDGLIVFVFEDDKRKPKRLESPIAEAHAWFEAVCDAITYLSEKDSSIIKSRVSVPAGKNMRVLLSRNGTKTNIYLEVGALTYFVNQQEQFIGALTQSFRAVTMPTRLAAKQVLRLLSS